MHILFVILCKSCEPFSCFECLFFSFFFFWEQLRNVIELENEVKYSIDIHVVHVPFKGDVWLFFSSLVSVMFAYVRMMSSGSAFGQKLHLLLLLYSHF